MWRMDGGAEMGQGTVRRCAVPPLGEVVAQIRGWRLGWRNRAGLEDV